LGGGACPGQLPRLDSVAATVPAPVPASVTVPVPAPMPAPVSGPVSAALGAAGSRLTSPFHKPRPVLQLGLVLVVLPFEHLSAHVSRNHTAPGLASVLLPTSLVTDRSFLLLRIAWSSANLSLVSSPIVTCSLYRRGERGTGRVLGFKGAELGPADRGAGTSS